LKAISYIAHPFDNLTTYKAEAISLQLN